MGAGEEDLIFEYLNLLVSRPEVARALGARARDYVARECNWATVAAQYAGFLDAVVRGMPGNAETPQKAERSAANHAAATRGRTPPSIEYLQGWASGEARRSYLDTHQTRLVKTLEITPPRRPMRSHPGNGRVSADHSRAAKLLGYGEVRGCYYGKLGRSDHRTVTSAEGETFACEIDHFDAEKDVSLIPTSTSPPCSAAN